MSFFISAQSPLLRSYGRERERTVYIIRRPPETKKERDIGRATATHIAEVVLAGVDAFSRDARDNFIGVIEVTPVQQFLVTVWHNLSVGSHEREATCQI